MHSPRGLPPAAFTAAFPFHLWLDAELRLIQAGEALLRVLPELRLGAPAFAQLQLTQPACEPTVEAMCRHADEPVVLTAAPLDMRLRGQGLCFEDGSLLLLLWPWISDEVELDRWGLSVDDFPHHSMIGPQLGLLQDLWAHLEDTQLLVARLDSQRRQLLESRQRTELLLQHTPLAIIDWSSDGTITAWNPAAANIFGITAEQALGRGVEALGIARRSPPAGEALPANANLLDHDDGRILCEHLLATRTIVTAWHNTPLVDGEGRRLGTTSVIRDVTEATRSEQSERERQRLESLSLLAGGIAHDFNNLLATMLGNADLALLSLATDSPAIAYIEEVGSAAERAAGLTRQLLAYAGRGSYKLEPTDLGEVVEQLRGLLRISIGKQIELTVTSDPRLPAISGDAGQLGQVILNLVSNAAEAIGEGPGQVRLESHGLLLDRTLDDPQLQGGPLEPGVYVRLEVRDDGAGMTPEVLSRIFDPFFTTKFTGRGLGLAAILGVVKAHRGGLRVESEPGKGTRFELLFPALDAAVHPAPRPGTAPSLSIHKGRLLVVDDEAQVRRMVVSALAEVGFEVVAAEAGREALALFDSDPQGFDLVLTDLTMPDFDGQALFDALTRRDPELPVILSSGYSEREVTAHYPSGAPVPFLKKPYRLGHLLATVTASLERR